MSGAYNGICIGGPLDGALVSSDARHYRVAEKEPMPAVNYYTDLTAVVANVTSTAFEYKFFEYLGFKGWVPIDVHNGKRYQHKIWDHPMEYVFHMLLKNYRPEGF